MERMGGTDDGWRLFRPTFHIRQRFVHELLHSLISHVRLRCQAALAAAAFLHRPHFVALPVKTARKRVEQGVIPTARAASTQYSPHGCASDVLDSLHVPHLIPVVVHVPYAPIVAWTTNEELQAVCCSVDCTLAPLSADARAADLA